MDSAQPNSGQKHFLELKKLSRKTVIFITLAVAASASITVYILFFTGPTFKNSLEQLLKKEPTVQTKTTNKNPFAKETQYVNPFDSSKSPFYALKQKEAETKK